jgi:hypothetical protein
MNLLEWESMTKMTEQKQCAACGRNQEYRCGPKDWAAYQAALLRSINANLEAAGKKMPDPEESDPMLIVTDPPLWSWPADGNFFTPIVTLYADGRMHVDPGYSLDQAARAFWDAVIQSNPILKVPPAGGKE